MGGVGLANTAGAAGMARVGAISAAADAFRRPQPVVKGMPGD
ncbi:hypothetical protein [Cryobacterium psychrophilum]|nr:hypothetical protein [Cryobacterium psychrophilum]TDW29771.1 hypothetical protein EDD25_1481 [Cryobacterium psychrophilum]